MSEKKIRESLRATATAWAHDRGYRVDDDGNVIAPSGRKRKPQVHKAPRGGGLYHRFSIRIPGAGVTTVEYHQLAAYQKFGDDALVEGVHVRHLDGNSENNRPDNIELGSQSDNMMDQPAEVRIERARNAARRVRKLNDIQVAQLRRDREAGMTLKKICEKYGLPKSTASYIMNRKSCK